MKSHRRKQIFLHVETNPVAFVELSMASADNTCRTQTNKGLKYEASTLEGNVERSQNNSENRRCLQSFDSSGEQQDVLLHLGVDLRLRGSRVLPQELCNAQDTVSLVGVNFVLAGDPIQQLSADLDARHCRQDPPVLLSLRVQPLQQRHLLE